MGKIEWSSPPKDDLYEIHSRISKDSLRFADAFIDEIISKVFLLEKQTRIGKRILRVDHDALRELLVQNHRVIYSIEKDRIFILRVLHSLII